MLTIWKPRRCTHWLPALSAPAAIASVICPCHANVTRLAMHSSSGSTGTATSSHIIQHPPVVDRIQCLDRVMICSVRTNNKPQYVHAHSCCSPCQPMTHHLEAQALHSLHSQLNQLLLLFHGQNGGAIAACLVEVGLHRGPVVSDGAVHSLQPSPMNVDIANLVEAGLHCGPAVCEGVVHSLHSSFTGGLSLGFTVHQDAIDSLQHSSDTPRLLKWGSMVGCLFMIAPLQPVAVSIQQHGSPGWRRNPLSLEKTSPKHAL